jgi:hypothetical protein
LFFFIAICTSVGAGVSFTITQVIECRRQLQNQYFKNKLDI